MKVLLINPPQTFYPGSEQPAGNLPIGLMYIAAVLQKAEVKVEILDAFMAADFSKKTGETLNVGMPFEQIKQEIEATKTRHRWHIRTIHLPNRKRPQNQQYSQRS